MTTKVPLVVPPTLQEIPPEKGSILELHSINDRFNGMLVEFQGIDKASKKYRVGIEGPTSDASEGKGVQATGPEASSYSKKTM